MKKLPHLFNLLLVFTSIGCTFLTSIKIVFASEHLESAKDNSDQTKDWQEKAPLYFTLGEQRLLPVSHLKKFSLGSPILRSLQLPKDLGRIESKSVSQKNENAPLLLKAVSLGKTDLWVWKQDGSSEHRIVHVLPNKNQKPPGYLPALGRLNEVEVYDTGEGVVLRVSFILNKKQKPLLR